MPMLYMEIFSAIKTVIFSRKKKRDIFVQKINCGYMLEPPQNKKRYTPAHPIFYYIKEGIMGYNLECCE